MQQEIVTRICERCDRLAHWIVSPEAPDGDPLCANCQCDDIDALIKRKFAEQEEQRRRVGGVG